MIKNGKKQRKQREKKSKRQEQTNRRCVKKVPSEKGPACGDELRNE